MPSLSVFAQTSGFQAISDANGISIAVTGMLIVFSALTFITLFLRFLPTVLQWMEPILPQLEAHGHQASPDEQLPADQERIVAAIGYVLRLEMEKATGK